MSSLLPLLGKTVILTRPAAQPVADESFAPLRDAGAHVMAFPLIRIEPVAFEPPDWQSYDWIFFTSRNAFQAVQASLQGFFEAHSPSEMPRLASVGKATTGLIENAGFSVAYTSPKFDALSAMTAFAQFHSVKGLRILWPCGDLADRSPMGILTRSGAQVEPLVVYRTCAESEPPGLRECLQEGIDAVVFASPSAVEAWSRLTLPLPREAVIASIGPSTSKALRTCFGRVDLEANPHTMTDLSRLLLNFFLGNAESVVQND